MFSKEDLAHLKKQGIHEKVVFEQLERFEKGFPFLKLESACSIGHGIKVIVESEYPELERLFDQERRLGRYSKFVPASGAASRMFKLLLAVYHKEFEPNRNHKDKDNADFFYFIDNIEKLAFYEEWKYFAEKENKDLRKELGKGNYRAVLEILFDKEKMNLIGIPKGLIPFHRYADHIRTAFEEHLAESTHYITDIKGLARVHFTVAEIFEKKIKKFFKEKQKQYETDGMSLEITISTQKTSTHTLAADAKDNPFRDRDGNIVFRPGGHGALIENLYDLKGDIVFIKNIDTVAPDPIKPEMYLYKYILGGHLLRVQKQVFSILEKLEKSCDKNLIQEAFDFLERDLSVFSPEEVFDESLEKQRKYLIDRLNRPLRVCGMVKNTGESGGGPFWVRGSHGDLTLQIVESSQVDLQDPEQKAIWHRSTHFNPVDIVCAVRDYKGKLFNLRRFIDLETGFISIKSEGGKELKALELPGLWNGAMAYWNTVFIEVPIKTFTPVKTINDLLRPEHQMELEENEND